MLVFAKMVVQFKLQAKGARRFDILVFIRNKQTQKPADGLRVTLIRDTVELESLMCEEGRAAFENIWPGAYSVDITGIKDLIAAIRIDIQV